MQNALIKTINESCLWNTTPFTSFWAFDHQIRSTQWQVYGLHSVSSLMQQLSRNVLTDVLSYYTETEGVRIETHH